MRICGWIASLRRVPVVLLFLGAGTSFDTCFQWFSAFVPAFQRFRERSPMCAPIRAASRAREAWNGWNAALTRCYCRLFTVLSTVLGWNVWNGWGFGLALYLPYRLRLAAMFLTAASASNSLMGGYSARGVFRGRGSGGLGKFAGRGANGRRVADRPSGKVRARNRAGVGQLAGAAALATAMQGFQALSAVARIFVAWLASHGAPRMADLCGFQGVRRHMASYRTAGRNRSIPARWRVLPATAGGGGRPPLRLARAPYAPFGRWIRKLGKSIDQATPRFDCLWLAPRWRSAPGSEGRANIQSEALGSGVRGARTSVGLAAERRWKNGGKPRLFGKLNGYGAHEGSGSGKVRTLRRMVV